MRDEEGKINAEQCSACQGQKHVQIMRVCSQLKTILTIASLLGAMAPHANEAQL